ncbi:dsDNA nuclease domain-containing protein [Bradyrhizobium sp. LCT2]|uniref:dsDNA nuclease domain-containing protein n=1 Tax=Bradyrhizobium sp. LCT2 TaxID=2493093 RepID=UPI0013751D42|nr:dsDNA nuclease domain-containing protein [Bradyrhizobium sp. LCT2]
MSFADRLIAEPQREKSGETGYERFDYQALWGLALIFAHHGSSDDYAIAFEFHDDIVLLDSERSPSRARFYQVKTRDKGHWTLTDLSPQSKKGRHGWRKAALLHGKAFFQLCHVS